MDDALDDQVIPDPIPNPVGCRHVGIKSFGSSFDFQRLNRFRKRGLSAEARNQDANGQNESQKRKDEKFDCCAHKSPVRYIRPSGLNATAYHNAKDGIGMPIRKKKRLSLCRCDDSIRQERPKSVIWQRSVELRRGH